MSRPVFPCGAALLAFFVAGCNPVFYQPSRKIHGDAAKAGHAFVDHAFPSGSGNTLHGRLFPHSPSSPRKGLWIFFHGNSRNLSGTYDAYAWVTGMGWDYFIFDYSGYGRSEGKASREALYQDGLACLRYVEACFPLAPGEKLVLSGESLGGAVLLASAAGWEARRKASLIFVDCTFPSYRALAQAILADRPYAWPFQWLGPALVTDSHSPQRTLRRLENIPLLISHCREDGEIPFRMGVRLHAAAGGPKWFWPLEGCRHTRGFTDRFPENRRRLMALADSLPAARLPAAPEIQVAE